MSIKYYEFGEHPGGFVGYRVTVGYSNKYLQRYFSTNDAYIQYQDDRCPWFKRQRLRAEIQNAEWEADSALYQYHRFVTKNHPSTGTFNGTGVHGITCQWSKDRRGQWQAGFAVNLPSKQPGKKRHPYRFYSFRTRLYSDVWAKCVNLWGDLNNILETDRQRVLQNPPPPRQFVDLRRELNDKGADIPTEKLRPVFLEQRTQLQSRKNTNACDRHLSETEQDVTAWFEKHAT